MYKIIPPIENLIKKLPERERDKARYGVVRAITTDANRRLDEKRKELRYERKELMELRKNTSISITKADKSDQIIIMDKVDYIRKVCAAIDEIPRETDVADQTDRIRRKLSEFKNHSKLPQEIKRYCYTPNGATVPAAFGQLKTHKPDQPMRILVSSCTAPTAIVEKATARYLKPLVNESKRIVTNPSQVLEKIKNYDKYDENSRFASLDVVNLYPRTPVRKAQELIRRKLLQNCANSEEEIMAIMSLLKFLSDHMFFRFNNVIYRQKDGAPIGGALSTIYSEMILQDIEHQVLNNRVYTPEIYLRYVDDTLILWKHGKEELEKLRTEMSQIYDTIEFTIENEKDMTLPYLDILIKRKTEGVETKVYRKETYVPTVIPANSHHPVQHKMAAFRAFVHRAMRVCSEQRDLEEELHWIKSLAAQNGYQKYEIERLIEKIKNKSTNKPNHDSVNTKDTSITFIGAVPYQETRTKCIKNILRKYDYTVGDRVEKIRNIALSDRDVIEEGKRIGVYQIPIKDEEDNERVYVGSTRVNFDARIKQHKADVRLLRQTTALSRMHSTSGNVPMWDKVQKVTIHKKEADIRHHESMVIYSTKDININDEEPVKLASAWKYLLEKNKERKEKNNSRKEQDSPTSINSGNDQKEEEKRK